MPADAAPDILDLFCPHCDYNLRSLTVDRCPECGHPFDCATLSRARIPWMQRLSVGRFRAFLATTWLATACPSQLALAAGAPLPLPAARRFCAIAMLLLYALTAWPIFWLDPDSFRNLPDWGADFQLPIQVATSTWLCTLVYWPALLLAIPLVLCALAARSTSDSVQRERATAIALYLCGALLLAALAGALIIYALVGIWIAQDDELAQHVPLLLAFPLGTALLLTLARAFIVHRHLTRASPLRSLIFAAGLLLLWCGAILAACVALPWSLGLLRIIHYSLRW